VQIGRASTPTPEKIMKLNRASRILPLVGACVLAAMSAQASIVNYSATGVIDGVDDLSSLLPHSLLSAAVGKSLVFNFGVDTSTPGSGTSGDTTYLSALRSESYKFNGKTSSLDFGVNAIEILNNSGGNTGYLMESGDPVGANFTGTAEAVIFLTLAYSGATLNLYPNTALSNAPLSSVNADAADGMILSFTQYVDGVAGSSSSVQIGSMSIKQVSVAAPEMDPTSAASGMTLLVGGLLVVFGRSRRLLASAS
jgi:hypothetical protein